MPDPLFTRSIIVRGAFLWAGVRLLIASIGLPAGRPATPAGVPVAVIVIAVTVLLAAIELRRRNEFLFLGSLGHSPALLLVLSGIPAVPLEIALTFVLG